MGKVIYEGKTYNIVKYDGYTIQQKNGVRVSTHKQYDMALKQLRKLESK
jgi:hypothetical protein